MHLNIVYLDGFVITQIGNVPVLTEDVYDVAATPLFVWAFVY